MSGIAAHLEIRKAQGVKALRLLAFSSALALSGHGALAQDDTGMMPPDVSPYQVDSPSGMPQEQDVSPQGQAQLQVRLSQLEGEIASLTGRIEQQQHLLQTLQTQLDDNFKRLDQRLTALEQSTPPASPPVSAGMPPQPGRAPAGLGQEDMGGPQDFGGGTATINPDDPAPAGTANTLGTLNQTTGAVSAPPAASGDMSPEASYEAAYAALKNRRYDESERRFKDFLGKNPAHPLAANATYWMGETYYVRGQFDQASRVFAEAYQKYPQSPKAADALLKLGLSLNGMGKKNEACLTYAQFRKQFPAVGPVASRAAQEAKKIGCS